MQLLGTTIESWPDVLYVTRKTDFHFSELWNKRKELQKMSCDPTFFSDDSLMGLNREMKQRVFAYSSSVLFDNETNSTSLLTLEKDDKKYFTFQIKKIIDGQQRPYPVCDVSLKSYQLNNLNELLLEIEKQLPKEHLLAIAGLLILLCDGVSSITIDDAWVKANRYDILHYANIQVESIKDEFVIPVYQSTYSINAMSKPIFPLQPRVFVNCTDSDISLNFGSDVQSIKPDGCIVGLFHQNQCYCLLKNEDKCEYPNLSLSIHFDRNKKQTYLLIGDNPIYRVISFLCENMGHYMYVLEDGTINYDNDFPFQVWYERNRGRMEADEKILAVSAVADNKYRVITNKRILET